VLSELARSLVRVRHDNLVERPWGGDWIRRYKRVDAAAAAPWGEAFEISAFDADAEARRFPSRLQFADGSTLALPALLEAHGEALLSADFVARHGACFPLLPKTLCVKELLSVQGHPPGNTEVYIIIDAEPGATLRLGFRRDVDPDELRRMLAQGLSRQRELLALFATAADGHALQAALAPWFANRDATPDALIDWLAGTLPESSQQPQVLALIDELKGVYWHMLDAMNAIEVKPGQVIYNATPDRLRAASGAEPSAEVHALGNPEGRQILALEIRRPGPTFRAWDNVRFPQRDVDVDAAIAALNLRGTRPEEYFCELVPVPGRAGAFVSVDCEYFRVEHLRPETGVVVPVPAGGPHALHCLAGAVTVRAADGREIGQLRQGESAFVPAGVGAYRVTADAPADVVRVTLPEH